MTTIWTRHPGDGDAGRERRVIAVGADVEFGNIILGAPSVTNTDVDASQRLLREIAGVPAERPSVSQRGRIARVATTVAPVEMGRRYLPATGGAAYIDQWKMELNTPEVRSAYDHVAAWQAFLRIAQGAQVSANAKLPPGQTLCVLVNNSDGHNSWGAHLSFLISRRLWTDLMERKPHYQAFLAALQVSSICITGQGKVGADNGTPAVAFQLSQRADFFERLVSMETTVHRGLLNTRDESLCGSNLGLARYHCIFFDSSLAQVPHLLKVGLMQIGLAILDGGAFDPRLALEDAVEAVVHWSHDPTLQARARLVSGRTATVVELQERFCDAAERFVADGRCEGIVPRAAEIVAVWRDTVEKLKAGDFAALERRLDWVRRLSILTRVLRQRPHLTWRSPEIRHLDHCYALLDRNEGLFWAYEAAGAMERVVSEDEITSFVHNPPADTRAYTRAMLLRLAPPDTVYEIDWDHITFEVPAGSGVYRRLALDDPLGFTRDAVGHVFREGATLEAALAELGAPVVPAPRRPTHPYAARSAWWLGPAVIGGWSEYDA